MKRRRSRRQRARSLRRAEERQRDLVVVAAAVEGFDHAHAGLLAERIASDSPLVGEPLRPQVLTHDESGGSDE